MVRPELVGTRGVDMETVTATGPPTSAMSSTTTEISESLGADKATTTTTPLGQPQTKPSSESASTTTSIEPTQLSSQTQSISHPQDGKDVDGVGSGTSNLPAPAPNFRVEGSGHGDSSVTVAAATANTSVTGSLMDESVSLGSGTTNGGSFPSGSEEMPLSLLSWYSEPGEQTGGAHGNCCQSNHSSTATLITRDTSSEEKENKTPGQGVAKEGRTGVPIPNPSGSTASPQINLSRGTRARMQQVQVQQQKQKTGGSDCRECPRCARRSKSGTTTPAAAPSRISSRRLIQVTSAQSSSLERKPIKSILKSDSRGSGGSGSGSEKQSSMDSLGSSSGGPTMTRSDTGPRARAKFNLSDSFSSESVSGSCPAEDRIISKLKRIEKYATVRLKQRPRVSPGDVSAGEPGVPSDLMSKSMTYLEEHSGNVNSGPNSLSLRRQGSLRSTTTNPPRKTSPMWEPPSTRTSALRLQKMQESKAGGKQQRSGSSPFTVQRQGSQGSGSSHSHHSGSGDSIHNTSGHFMSSTPSRGTSTSSSKEKHFGAKLFSKISSVMSQTTSSAMKRLRQERGVQTDMTMIGEQGCQSPVQLSPEPPDPIGGGNSLSWDQADQLKHLDSLVQRYKTKAVQYQRDCEKLNAVNRELTKQLQETQTETTEMIDFLQAEKSTLAESLTETETESKRLREQMESVTRESQSRCSSLVRLSEQHKQEALKSLALLNRLETHSKNELHQQRFHLSEGAAAIQQMKLRVLNMIEVLLKTYKVPQERINTMSASGTGLGVGLDETDLSCSLLLPLIKSLSNAFQVPLQFQTQSNQTTNVTTTGGEESVTTVPIGGNVTTPLPPQSSINTSPPLINTPPVVPKGNNSFQNLNQAILERQEAERLGLEGISPGSASSPDEEYLLLGQEINELQAALGKLVTVIRAIVIHCDQRVSSVASNILQVLKSSETEKMGGRADMDLTMAHVQKSLEAWSLTDQQNKASSSTSGSSASASVLNGSGPSRE